MRPGRYSRFLWFSPLILCVPFHHLQPVVVSLRDSGLSNGHFQLFLKRTYSGELKNQSQSRRSELIRLAKTGPV